MGDRVQQLFMRRLQLQVRFIRRLLGVAAAYQKGKLRQMLCLAEHVQLLATAAAGTDPITEPPLIVPIAAMAALASDFCMW